MTTVTNRTLDAVVPAIHTKEGGGFGVYRPFPTTTLDMLDPFLLLDEMEPTRHAPGQAKGAPDHPHRGFETVTYLLDGEFEHHDSTGGHGVTVAGGVQWMTAGDGVVHSEMPSAAFQTRGGVLHGFQLWVNLPRELKRTAPRYQGVDPSEVGTASGEGWTVKVISGSLLGATGPASTHTPVVVAHLHVAPTQSVELELPDDHNVGLYAFGGSAQVNATAVPNRHLALSGRHPGSLTVHADEAGVDMLVLAGKPLDEPVARYGPFVMNTKAELIEAFEDYQSGRMGAIAAHS